MEVTKSVAAARTNNFHVIATKQDALSGGDAFSKVVNVMD